jgi:predicted RNA-binding Zn-ribbon protein involved in translation (DUF1610 family)
MAKIYDGSFCQKCGKGLYRKTGERTGGFSGKKAVVGAIIAGPVGVAAGAFGKKKTTYRCSNCGYTAEQ